MTTDVTWGRVPRVLALGIDGLDYFLTRAWLADGTMPNLAALADCGRFGRLETVNPAVSPVAWSSFLTGCNPGRHGVFDFVSVDPRTMSPGPAAVRRTRTAHGQQWVCQRRLPGLAELLAASEVPATQVFAPVSFPAPPGAGFVICGMETPDRNGTEGAFRMLTADPEGEWAGDRRTCKLEPDGGALTATVQLADAGPMRITLRVGDGAVLLDAPGGPVRLAPGQWSDWLTYGAGQDATVVRFCCHCADPPTLYMSPPQYAPDHPLVTTHPERARALAACAGTYPTLGYPYDTAALADGALDDRQFLEHTRDTAQRLHAVARAAAAANDADVFVAYFTEIDAIQHMFWREMDYGHPLHRDAALVRGVIRDAYREIDAVIGSFVAGLGERTAIFVISDHGCSGFRLSFDVNRWLHENGYLAWDSGAGQVNGLYWGVDWAGTRAYSYGMGRICLNLEGRERYGTVQPGAAAEALLSEISGKLLTELIELGAGRVVSRVWRSGELYQGEYTADAPDLTIGFEPGLRADSSSALGGMASAALSANKKKWSGDHASVDPALVPGVLVSNRTLRESPHRLIDLTPTVLDSLGVPAPPHMDGSSLWPGPA